MNVIGLILIKCNEFLAIFNPIMVNPIINSGVITNKLIL